MKKTVIKVNDLLSIRIESLGSMKKQLSSLDNSELKGVMM